MTAAPARLAAWPALLYVALAAAPVAAQAPAPPPPPAARPAPSATDVALAESFLAALRGDAKARAAWIEARVSPEALAPKAELAAILDRLATTPGVKPGDWSRRGRWLQIPVTNDKGRYARIRLDVDPADPSRIKGIVQHALPRPYAGPRIEAPVSREALRAAIKARVDFAAAHDDFSGAVLVIKGDEVIYQGAAGLADRDHAVANTLDTRFHLGSMDKQFTAVAVGQLIEAGKLSLDTRLIEVLPDYPNKAAAAKITIRQLLTHTAGLGGLFDRDAFQRDKDKPFTRVSELLPTFAGEPLQFEPGTSAGYSNEGFVVLGAVIEKVSGETWFDYVRRHVFEPAGMTATGSPSLDEVAPGRAVGYLFPETDPLGFGARRPNWLFLGYRGNSCGGGYSTARDMTRFLQALHAGRLLKPETLKLFTADYAGGLGGYGMGFQRIDGGARTLIGHSGGGANSGINSDARIVWQTGYVFAVLGNYDAPFAEALGGDIAMMLEAQE